MRPHSPTANCQLHDRMIEYGRLGKDLEGSGRISKNMQESERIYKNPKESKRNYNHI